jgi:AraC family transcriptional regulator
MDLIETLYVGDLGSIELLRCSGLRAAKGKSELVIRFHMVIPLQGSFVWHVGTEEIFADPTRVLFAGGGERYAISHPAGGDRSLVITPSSSVLEELMGDAAIDQHHPLLKARWRAHAYQTQLLERILCRYCDTGADPLAIEETLTRLLTLLFDEEVRGPPQTRRGVNRTLGRAKAFLHATASARTTLGEIAQEVGVSPAYLTRLFTAAEGMPLHQYALKLKLSAALDALPEGPDITHLALDLGFCSHSHLTSSFRSRFGIPPSSVRAMLRGSQLGSPGLDDAPIASMRPKRPLCEARGGFEDHSV